MTKYLFTNNATGALASDITALATSMDLGVGEGSLFPNPVSGEAFRVTIQSGSDYEIVEVTGRTSDTFTIVRAREGTSARAWSAGAAVDLRMTAEVLGSVRDGAAAVAAIGALTPIADRVPYFTSAGAAALATFTSFGRSLIASASASAARTVLELGNSGVTAGAYAYATLTVDVLGRVTAAVGKTGAEIAAFLIAAGYYFFPSGGIIMWSGAIADIPSGWYLCDGTNGTPNLVNAFVIGAGTDDVGVAKTDVTGALTLSGGSKDAINVSHTHTATVTDPGHDHDLSGSYTSEDNNNTAGSTRPLREGSGSTGTFTNSTEVQSATTGVTVAVESSGVSGTDANLPPYYALAFIMKA